MTAAAWMDPRAGVRRQSPCTNDGTGGCSRRRTGRRSPTRARSVGVVVGVKQEVVDLSGEAWERLRSRFEGLTDEEYLWEPAPGCWTVRRRADGAWTSDSPLPRPEPEPFTTIAWRMWHLIDMYGENRAPEWLGVGPQGDPIGLDDPEGAPPPSAVEALMLLERAHDRWDAHLALVSEGGLGEKVGAVGHGYADRTRVAYVLHMLDEFIHHSAEIAVLRDLWRWQHSLTTDALTDRVMRGDASVLGEISDLDDRSATALVNVAASYGRWELVTRLVGAGVPPEAGGRTPLHLAAGAGELDVVRTLVEHGADTGATDPEYHATPLQWAQFLKRDVVANWLESHTAE